MSRTRTGLRSLATMGLIATLVALFGVLTAGNASAVSYFRIRSNTNPNICVGLQQSTGPNVVIGTCSPGSLSQQWYVWNGPITLRWDEAHVFTYYQFANRGTNRCLGVTGGSSAGGAPLVVGPCQSLSDHSQVWASVLWSNGVTTLINGHSGLCVGTRGSSLAPGTQVLQGGCSFTDSQDWSLVAA